MQKNILDSILLEKEESMKTGKAKGWLGEYHWISLPWDPNKTDYTQDIINWCEENLGKSGSRWFEKNRKFYFKNEKDMTIFILRWS